MVKIKFYVRPERNSIYFPACMACCRSRKKQQSTGLFDTKDTLTPDTVAENSPGGQNMDVFLSLFPNFRFPWMEFLSLSFSNR